MDVDQNLVAGRLRFFDCRCAGLGASKRVAYSLLSSWRSRPAENARAAAWERLAILLVGRANSAIKSRSSELQRDQDVGRGS